MTDSEWITNIHNFSNAVIFEQLEQIGCDGYYRDIWSACIEELQRRVNLTSGDSISREYVESIVKAEFVDLQDGTEEWRTYVNDTCENILIKVHNAPTVPERLQGDLISREALKAAFEDTVCIEPMPFAFVKQIIDNAPTVTPDKIQAMMSDYLVYRCEPQKPQNKWIKIFENPFTNGYVCPFCGHKIQVTEQFLPQVTKCESCGADMTG